MLRRLLLLGALAGCGSSSATADPNREAPPAPAPPPMVPATATRTATGPAADTPAVAPPVAPQPELILPDKRHIVSRPTLAEVKKNKWWEFGGAYWRMWGGSLAGSQPKGVSVTPDGKIFLTNTGFHDHENVHRWDPDKLTVIARVDFKGNAVESEVSPDGKIIYVSNFYHREMLALSTDDLKILRRYKVGNVPKHFAIAPDGKTLYVSNWSGGTVSVLDPDSGTVTRTIKVGKQPRGTAITRDGKKVYVTEFGSNEISVIDTDKLDIIATIDPHCRAPRHAVATRDDKFILATCYGGNEMLVIDRNTDKIVRRVVVGRGPKTVDVSRDGKFAFTADYRDNTISFIDLATWETRQIPLPVHKTSGVTVTHDDSRVYVTGWDSRNLIVIERLMPGIAPGKPSPKQASGKCERVPESECRKYP